MEVIGLWLDDGFTPRTTPGFIDALRQALSDYLRFAGATHLEWAPHRSAEQQLLPERTG